MQELDYYDAGLLYEEEENEYGNPETEDAVICGGSACAAVHSAADALVYCINERGCVDFSYMSQCSGMTPQELVDQLQGRAVFQDPLVYDRTQEEYSGWILSEQYFAGNLVKKLRIAEQMNRRYGRFGQNVSALRKHLPDMPKLDEVHICLGASWVPEQFYVRFIEHLLDPYTPPSVKYVEYLGRWKVKAFVSWSSVNNNYVYGTGRMKALQIIEHTMNAMPVKVTDSVVRDGKTVYILNKEETLLAQEKQRLIIAAFEEWIHSDPKAAEQLEEVYSDRYGYNISHYDGSFLELPGVSPKVELYRHQKDAVARIVLTKNTLLAHDVGAGKTYEMAAGAHELKRMGLSSRNLMVVPNTVLDASAAAHQYLYPEDELLVIRPSDFTPAKRQEALRRIRYGDYTAVYMACSTFDRIRMTPEYYLQKLLAEIRQCRAQMDACTDAVSRHVLQTELKRLSKKLPGMEEKKKNAKDTDCFDLLGITALFVDEAHSYKNISIDTRSDGVTGMHGKGSSRADEMLEKVHYVQDTGGRIVFATGTPLTNSLADLYVLQRFLQNQELEICGISQFSQWLNTFAQQESTFEMDVDSVNFRFKTRYSRFHNLPELMCMFASVCDFYHIDKSDMNLPEFRGYTDVVVRRSPEQIEYLKDLADRTDQIRKHYVSRSEDNLLKVTTDGRKCALDVRLVMPDAHPNPLGGKIAACARRIIRLMREYPGSSQLVFCDTSIPQEGFNVYDELKRVLVSMGVREDEIAFIHDGSTRTRRESLIRSVNRGKVRVLIGSTMKLGTGVNVQENLIAVHHLDIPWRPADMMQRNGRLIRSGNSSPEVFIFRYVTECSFDAYTYQILENKQKFISGFLSGTMSAANRSEKDIDDLVLDYSEIKALAIGNPLIKLRVEKFNRLQHLRIAKRQKDSQLKKLQELTERYPKRSRELSRMLEEILEDRQFYLGNKTGINRSDRELIGEILLLEVSENGFRTKERSIGSYQGFSLVLPAQMNPEKPFVFLRRKEDCSYSVDLKDARALGCCQRMDYVLDHLSERADQIRVDLKKLERALQDASAQLLEGNPYDDELTRVCGELEQIDEQLKVC